jgi:AcrR family transcriptional regulator
MAVHDAQPPQRLSDALRPPRVGPPADQLTPRLRQILDDLEALIVREGFAKLTIADMAAHLRCSRRTLYELAPTRDELILIVVDRRFRRIGRQVRERLEGVDDPVERLRILLATETTYDMHATTARFREDVLRQPSVERLIAGHYRYAAALIRETLESGIVTGDFRPLHARVVAEIIDAAVPRIQDPNLLRETGLTYADTAKELLALIESGVLPRVEEKRRQFASSPQRARRQVKSRGADRRK